MPTRSEIETLLDSLNTQCADDLENQVLDFKEWPAKSCKSYADSGKLIIETAICLANADGGTIVIGVNDKAVGRAKAILGVPPDFDASYLKKSIYDNTDPRLTPLVEELNVPEGTGRLILVHVFPGMPPYTDQSGRAKIRVGKDCQPYTGSMRQNTLATLGENDLFRQLTKGTLADLMSPAGIEKLREIARNEAAPRELLSKTNAEFLSTLGLLQGDTVTKAGLILVGNAEAIHQYFPAYSYSYLFMESETSYVDRIDGHDCIAIAVSRIEERIGAHNQITTMRQGLLHFEYRTYPGVAIREALLNAFVHADYRVPGIIQIKQLRDRLEIANPGGFIGGVASDNILRHTPVARNAALANALIPLRLVNRSNVGVPRMYEAMLQEGKEPPVIHDAGGSVRVTFLRSDFSFAFRAFVADAAARGDLLSLEELLVMQYLLRHGEIEEGAAAHICQQAQKLARENLRKMERKKILLSRKRQGIDVWHLTPAVEQAISDSSDSLSSGRMDIVTAQIVEALKERMKTGDAGLTNAELRNLTGLERDQVKYVLEKLRAQNLVQLNGKGRGAKWGWAADKDSSIRAR